MSTSLSEGSDTWADYYTLDLKEQKKRLEHAKKTNELFRKRREQRKN